MRVHQTTRQSQKIDPKIIATSAILQLSSLELTQKIESELQENPALEEEKESLCPNCNQLMKNSICEHCGAISDDRSNADNLVWEQFGYYYDGTNYHHCEDQYDPLSRLEDEVSLQEHLQQLLRIIISNEDYIIGDFLISNIDDNGYLHCNPSEVAETLRLPEERVNVVLKSLQTLDPPGVGARTSQECLLLQLDYLADRGMGDPLAHAIVESYFFQLGNHRYKDIARALGVKVAEVQQASDFIRDNLNPYPGRQFRRSWDFQPVSRSSLTRPDVIIRYDGKAYTVEVVDGRDITLRINKFYRNLYLDMQNNRQSYTLEERKHTVGYIERAELLIKNIHQRRQTIHDITSCIADFQYKFLETGDRLDLIPLTRTRVAATLGTDESTVSRALTNKYVELPNHQITDYDIFFDASLSIKEIIRKILTEEDPCNPISDEDIKKKLCGMGYDIARRTVTKYREEMEVLSSNLRRRY
jgi:RNA polymerase sigma-54 factor